MPLWMNALRGAWLISVAGLFRVGGVWTSRADKKITAAEKAQDTSSAFRFVLAREFFQTFANEGRCNLHLELLYGDEPHHIAESLFKALLWMLPVNEIRDCRLWLPSTK